MKLVQRRPPAKGGTTTAWFHCFSGIAGDMALGALIDAGADPDEVRAIVRRIPLDDWSLDVAPVLRNGIAATHVDVRTNDTAIVRTYAHISGLLEEARLPDRVLARSLAAFEALAIVEGRLHRRPPSQVHFHEVGGVDAIVDIVGTCAALEVLEVDAIAASPIATGMGMIRSAHGMLPNPAPAVVELLRGAPTYGVDLPIELTTPTGAALLTGLGATFGPLPAMTVARTGFGAGTRELDGLPNVTQVVIGDITASALPAGQQSFLLETNVDDVTGETLAHAIGALLEAGAVDAWVTPIVMKKGRPAHMVSALCDPALAGQVAEVLAAETGTLGVRGRAVDRWPARRTIEQVEVGGATVRVKVSPGRVKVEHDDAARLARATGMPLREVVRLAETAWHEHGHSPGSDGDPPPPGDSA
jgi:uncharacterized protein (TIGR00299 family) protein